MLGIGAMRTRSDVGRGRAETACALHAPAPNLVVRPYRRPNSRPHARERPGSRRPRRLAQCAEALVAQQSPPASRLNAVTGMNFCPIGRPPSLTDRNRLDHLTSSRPEQVLAHRWAPSIVQIAGAPPSISPAVVCVSVDVQRWRGLLCCAPHGSRAPQVLLQPVQADGGAHAR